MALRDLLHNIQVVEALAPTAVAANGASAGAIIDTQGYDSVCFAIHAGTLTDGTYTPSIEEGDASNLSDTGAVAAGDLIGTIAGATFAATADNTVKRLGYKGSKRYLRLTVTAASVGQAGGGAISAVAILGNPRNAPVAQ